MATDVRLSDQQYALMSVLWRLGRAGAGTVRQELGAKAPAHTTIATLLARLEKKGVLSSDYEGRERIFSPTVPETAVKRSMVGSLLDTVFRGDAGALVAHMVREGDIDHTELDDIQAMLDAAREDMKDEATSKTGGADVE